MASPPSISPTVLFIIVILAVIFFVSGLLHLLIRFLIKKTSSHSSPRNPREFSGTDVLQRQLQQLFHLHDSGLDQASIDSLPVFLYREILTVGSNDPFDCAVCLCEFSREDQLRLLPACGHTFHLDCIDTWLLSNSTCPLCRGALVVENPTFDLDEDSRLDDVVSVRLGKFQSTGDDDNESYDNTITKREAGESSSSNLDARRCYSMGSYQYVLGDANLRVALSRRGKDQESSGNLVVAEEEGRRLGIARKGESFSLSKIWLWKNASASAASPIGAGLPWMSARRSVGDVV